MNECNVIRDLLPLWAEELVSEDTVEFITRHTENCQSCREAMGRCREELPKMEVTENMVGNYQKGLRKDTWKMALLTLCGWILTGVISLGIYLYFGWEKGDFAKGKLYSSPDGVRSVELVDLDGAGFFDNDGSLVKFRFERGFVNRYEVEWQDLTVHWAPDSQTMLLVIKNAVGEIELRIVDHKGGLPSGGLPWIPGLIPDEDEPDLTYLLKDLCAEQGVEATGFEFAEWEDDSETVIFRFVTDTQDTGFVSYHFPTETITKLYG